MLSKFSDQKDVLTDSEQAKEQLQRLSLYLIARGGPTIETPKLEGKDILAHNEVLHERLTDVVGKLAAHLLTLSPDARAADAYGVLAEEKLALQVELTATKASLAEHEALYAGSIAEIKTLNEKFSNFDMALAQEIAKAGIRATAITQPKAGKAVIPMGPGSGPSPATADGRKVQKDWSALCQEQVTANGGPTPIKRL